MVLKGRLRDRDIGVDDVCATTQWSHGEAVFPRHCFGNQKTQLYSRQSKCSLKMENARPKCKRKPLAPGVMLWIHGGFQERQRRREMSNPVDRFVLCMKEREEKKVSNREKIIEE